MLFWGFTMATRGALVLAGIVLPLLLYLLTVLMDEEETTAVETLFGKALITLQPIRKTDGDALLNLFKKHCAAELYWGSYWHYFQGFLVVLTALTAVYVSAWMYIREAKDAELRERRYQEEREERRNEKEAKRISEERREEERRNEKEAKRISEERREEATRKEKEQMAEILKQLIEGQGNRVFAGQGNREPFVRASERKQEKFRRFLEEKRTAINKYIEELRAVADEVDKFHKGAAIANVTGASVSAAGGIVTIVGLALAPFTLGASLMLSAVGTGVAVAGTVTKVTSGVSEAVSNKTDLKKVETILKSSSKDIGKVFAALEDFEKSIMTKEREEDREHLLRELKSIWQGYFNAEKAGLCTGNEFNKDTIIFMKDVMKSAMILIAGVLDDIVQAAAAAAARGGARAAAGTAAKATGIAGVLFLPLDAYDIYKNASDIHRGAKTDLASRIREIAARIRSIVKDPQV